MAANTASPAASRRSASQDWGRRIEAAVKQQSVDLRRFVVASLDSLAARFESDLRSAVPGPVAVPTPVAEAPQAPRRSAWPWIWAAAAVCLLAGLSTLPLDVDAR